MDDPIASAPETETAAAPRRRPTRLIAVTIIIALAGAGYAALSVYRASALAATRAAAAIDVETRWDAVEFSLGAIESARTRVGSMTVDDAEATVSSALLGLTTMEASATAAIDAMDADVKLLEPGDVRAAYTQCVSSARDAVKQAMKAKPALTALPEFYTGSDKVTSAIGRTRSRVNASIDAANSRKWSKAVAAAERAVKDVKGAEASLKRMRSALDAGTGITDDGDVALGLRSVSALRLLAERALSVCRIGRAHTSLSAYNSAIKAYNRAATASNKVEVPSFFVSPILFATAALDVLRNAGDSVDAAGTYHQKALRASLAKA